MTDKPVPADLETHRAQLRQAVVDLRTLFVVSTRTEVVQRDLDILRGRDNGGSEGGVLTLMGASRSGKTRLLRDYVDRHPGQPKAIKGENGVFSDRLEVVKMRMPDTNVKNFYERLFCLFANVSLGQADMKRRFDIQEDVWAMARTVGNRLVIIEECHEGINGKSKAAIQGLARALKDCTNESRFSIALAGTYEMRPLLDASPELRERVLFRHELTPFDWDDEGDREAWQQIIQEIDHYLKDNVFGELSGLLLHDIAKKLLEAADGCIGRATKLIEVAAYDAVDEMLEGTAKHITIAHLSSAYARSSMWKAAAPVFPRPPTPPKSEGDNVKTKMTGKTRRTKLDAEFAP